MDKKHNSSRDYITFYHEIYTLHPLEMWDTNSLISNFNLNKMWNGVRAENAWVKKEEIKVLSKETAKNMHWKAQSNLRLGFSLPEGEQVLKQLSLSTYIKYSWRAPLVSPSCWSLKARIIPNTIKYLTTLLDSYCYCSNLL